MNRAEYLKDSIYRAKVKFDLSVLNNRVLTNTQRLAKQGAWDTLQRQIAPLVTELMALEPIKIPNMWLRDRRPELLWLREHGSSDAIIAAYCGLSVWQVREILGNNSR